ncbi:MULTISPECIES: DsbA family protein [Citrobacter]|jgi:protein-disulfide isomerase|uniref:DsbA family protein n=1 Tax=Citrobacter arsenatis TaxID=2546350 RepID=A0A4P6WEJ4_9ENTR|nr:MULTISPECIES: DsbA family protein [Citrobacter]MDU4215912.1 DsbA family protein [Veillonella sp.]NTX86972.1 DsbA family protein [Citrobacter youngae]ATX99180.1 disulfide bond formation protein DsbA [Citrobacter freundii]EKU0824843.1 thioredoxin domain-containing protein [Citrobacter freundii]EKU3728909.1 thioredoxin domain-containing protein [Citrobacter freundii]
MKRTNLSLFIVATSCFVNPVAQASAQPSPFTPEQEARIGEIAADYLVAHPDVLVTVSKKLQEHQLQREQLRYAGRVMNNQRELLNDSDTPVIGPERAKVAVITFFDYQCVFCSKLAPALEKVMQTYPDVRYVFKELPIFGDRWENSLKAAERGLSVWKQKGAEGYMTYHRAIYRTGHDEGRLSADDISEASRQAGWMDPRREDFTPTLSRNKELAGKLGLTGTPGIIVMPVSGASSQKITVFPGFVPSEKLQSAIEKASR